jgi:hypothetical protein
MVRRDLEMKELAMRSRTLAFALAFGLGAPHGADAFCGFYVAKADSQLFNKASQVVMVRDGDRTVLTMANDFKGEPKEFAIVIPVPTFLEREQIHVGERAHLEHLDAFTSPRLVEYHDGDPCEVVLMYDTMASGVPPSAAAERRKSGADSLGVKIEAEYTVGEYDILILSAKESGGLETWLTANGYKIPRGAGPILGSYIKQNMRFFVAKVNLKEQAKLGFTYLRPIQVAYESPKFMLPIRLGTVNAEGTQELFVYALTRKGRVETTNYRTVKLPTDAEVPPFVKDEFKDFYRAMFDRQVKKEDMRVVFMEYAWDMNWCDPCAAEPLSREELRGLGVFWLDGGVADAGAPAGVRFRRPGPVPPGGGAQEVFATRLHVRYDAAHFPEDLVFQETADRQNFQGRYILRHPWKGKAECPEARRYFDDLKLRQAREAETLASLTGWELGKIHGKMGVAAATPAPRPTKKWYEGLWK